jgi:hypothetical protein
MALIEPYWFRATKATCLDLPPKRKYVVKLAMPPEMAAIYARVHKGGETALSGGSLSLNGDMITRLRKAQITGGHIPNLVDDFAVMAMENEESQVHLQPIDCSKVRWSRDWAREHLLPHPSSRAIWWCKYTCEVYRYAQMLRDILGPSRVAHISGDELSGNEIMAIKASFNSRDPDGVQVIVAQYRKFAFGQNLQACDTMVYPTHTDSPYERQQSEDRSHRYGRTAPVDYVSLAYEGTVDEDILQGQDEKKAISEQVSIDTVGAPLTK